MNRLVDLSHPWGINTPPWVGYPSAKIYYWQRLSNGGVNSQVIETTLHMGTHLDAPMHIVPDGCDIASLPLERLYGDGVIIDISDEVGEWDIIEPKHFTKKMEVRPGDILLYHTGYHHYYNGERQEDEERYMLKHPGGYIELANWLIDMKIRWTGFDCGSAVLHSHLTPSQKLKEWRRIQSGEAPLVIVARSAVFAPVKNLGLIIIDEEHENSYKAGSTPRYHGRQVAMRRCKSSSATLIMGSATPSVEAWHLMEKGIIKRLNLTRRLAGGDLPEIEIIDMKGAKGVLSATLIGAIRENASKGKQTILFLNRRGFSYFFHCRSCGYEMKCRNCSVSLTYHKNGNYMVCHYCGFKTRVIYSPYNL